MERAARIKTLERAIGAKRHQTQGDKEDTMHRKSHVRQTKNANGKITTTGYATTPKTADTATLPKDAPQRMRLPRRLRTAASIAKGIECSQKCQRSRQRPLQ